MTILVIGARGHVGAEVLRALIAAGEPVRVSSRDPKAGDFADGVEVLRADLTDPATFAGLLTGTDKVFLYANSRAATEFAVAAKDAGVQHVVVLSSSSVVMPGADTNPNAREHAAVERAIAGAGLDWTFIRPSYFATNTLGYQSIRTDRLFRTAFPDGTTPLVHERDIAEVAVRALLDDTLRGTAPLVLGGGSLSLRDQIGAISQAIGEPVSLEVVDVETYRAELRTQLPEPFVEAMIQQRGTVPQVPEDIGLDDVPELLGRPALTFAEWARDHAEDFR